MFGYQIPADTMMVTNLYGMHMDEKLWGDPENFRPERFLDHRGNLKKKDYSLPFGLGTFPQLPHYILIQLIFFSNFREKGLCRRNVCPSKYFHNDGKHFAELQRDWRFGRGF